MSYLLNYLLVMQLDYLKTTRQVAKMLGCTSRNVALMVKGNKLKPIKVLENGTFLFNTKDVEYYLLKLQNHE